MEGDMHENQGKRWSGEEVQTLDQLIRQGVPAAEIADVLGRTLIGIESMSTRIRQAGRREYECGRCHQVRPAWQFPPSRQLRGGYCRSCCRDYVIGAEVTDTFAI